MSSIKAATSNWCIHTRVLSLLFLLLLLLPAARSAAQYDDDYISYDDFYQSLAPYGQWIEDPQYGYVWSPGVDGEFRPYYTNGYWVMTEYGNTWISEYPWGWACFHYGRWTYDEYYGWLWLPGNNWGPAWVNWRAGDGFYGWAPLGPDYRYGSSVTAYNCPDDWWVFIPPQYIYSNQYYRYWNGPRGNNRIISNTVIVNNTFENGNVRYITGPHIAQVRQVTGNPVQVFKVRNSRSLNTRVHNDVVRMYRPAEIRTTSRLRSEPTVPPNVVTAPRPVRKPQAVNTNPDAVPPFRSTINEQNNNREITPGTNINRTATPTRTNRSTDTNPYEWDVTRPVKQETRTTTDNPRNQPRSNQQPAPARQQPTQQPTQQPQPAAPAPTRTVRESQPAPAAPQPAQRPGGRR
jgi:hypothetical protein